jgi:uncharacterized protein DUF1353
VSSVLTPLNVRYLNGDRWWLIDEYRCVSDTLGLIVIRAGSISDFNSVPRILTNILPREDYGEAAWPHDFLYEQGMLNGTPITRAQADMVHREFVIWAGVRTCAPDGTVSRVGDTPAWKVWAMYRGLRLGGWKPWDEYRARDTQAGAAR